MPELAARRELGGDEPTHAKVIERRESREDDAVGDDRRKHGGVMSVADEVYVLSSGRFVFQGTPAALANATQVLDQHLGISGTKLM